MGRMFAEDLASSLELERALEIHLKNNHYPPIPVEMVPACIEAIEVYCNDGDIDTEIILPIVNGWQVLYQGRSTAPAWAIVEQHHLDAWLPDEEPSDDFPMYLEYDEG